MSQLDGWHRTPFPEEGIKVHPNDSSGSRRADECDYSNVKKYFGVEIDMELLAEIYTGLAKQNGFNVELPAKLDKAKLQALRDAAQRERGAYYGDL